MQKQTMRADSAAYGSRPPDMWTENALAVRKVQRQSGQLPGVGGSAGEARLHAWLEHQRRAAQQGRLSPERRQMLDRSVAGWRRSRDDAWSERLEAARQEPQDPTARQWLRQQRRALEGGALRAERLAALDIALPGWQVSAEGTWEAVFGQLTGWIERTGQMPSHTKADGEQALLYRWLVAQRSFNSRGALSQKKMLRLQALAPGWQNHLAGPWENMAEAVSEHVRQTGVRPAAANVEQQQMARWLGTQRAALRAGRLSLSRRSWLDENIPGWAGGSS